ncbi:hypothetical protein [Costertonia aggregata]|uniref:Uncharacterized protein n=1 Tax=Costertonia aggregata TaxID=343403 RepID=A0A7H9AND4_9FLAO|nr:hypothetical protein [Costertonia aggregata]QLG44914.1 hypothetical protein HYG79_05950 [Costertonia aggregata]
MHKIVVLWIFIFVLVSCKKESKDIVQEDNTDSGLVTAKWKKKTSLNAEAQALVEDWVEFNALETSFDALYTVENIEDLTLVLEDLIQKQKQLQDADYPEAFDKPQVKSRQKVLKTFILKAKGNLEYQLDIDEVVPELIYAHNAFLNQFNVLVNNKLPDEILEDEKN